MLAFRDISIKNKLRIIILSTSGVVLLLASAAFITDELQSLRHRTISDLFVLADLVGINSSAGLLFDNPDTVEENIAALKANSHIIFAHIFSPNGELFASYIKEGAEQDQHLTSSKLADYYYYLDVPAGSQIEDNYFFHQDHLEVFKKIIYDAEMIGTVYIQSDLRAFHERQYKATRIVLLVLVASFFLAFLLASQLQRLITTPIYSLLATMKMVSEYKNYSLREIKPSHDELGSLIDGFNHMLTQIEIRDQELASANQTITALNKRLEAENLRMSAELDVAQKLQQMVLPEPEELTQVDGLDIAGFMEPADEVGGDYYDVLQHEGHVIFSIGDVTGHGLKSGVVMLMVQTAVRTLLDSGMTDSIQFLNSLNRTIYNNVQRMNSDKNLTLSLFEYQNGALRFTGQHEEVLVVRQGGDIERIDTFDLGFMVGVEPDITDFLAQREISLQPGDGVVLYTDGITEAQNLDKVQYGVERLCEVVSRNWHLSASEIQQAAIANVQQHIGEQKVFDDITLLVLKQKPA